MNVKILGTIKAAQVCLPRPYFWTMLQLFIIILFIIPNVLRLTKNILAMATSRTKLHALTLKFFLIFNNFFISFASFFLYVKK